MGVLIITIAVIGIVILVALVVFAVISRNNSDSRALERSEEKAERLQQRLETAQVALVEISTADSLDAARIKAQLTVMDINESRELTQKYVKYYR